MKKLIYLVLILFSTSVFSQKNTFVVIDKDTKKPIEYANILLSNKNKGTYSDSKGVFSIECNLSDTLCISHLSYKDTVRVVSSIKDTIWLSNKNVSLKEILISSEKKHQKWSRSKKAKIQWYIQPKTEFCFLLQPNKNNDVISEMRFPLKYIKDNKSDKIKNSVFRLNFYKNNNGIGEKIETNISLISDFSEFVYFELNEDIQIPKRGIFIGIEFIGFKDFNDNIIDNQRNNYMELGFTSSRKSNTYYSNKFINQGKWTLLSKDNSVFPFKLKEDLSLIFSYK